MRLVTTSSAEQILEDTRFSIGIATNDDGPEVRRLVEGAGFLMDLEIDWDDIFPYWLIARLDGKAVGCVQVAISKPIGRIEILSLDPDLTHMMACQKLLIATKWT